MELAVGKQKVAWVSVSFSLSIGCPSTVRGAGFPGSVLLGLSFPYTSVGVASAAGV